MIRACSLLEIPTGRFPDFIIIGAAKAGTTALYETLRRHPRVFMPRGRFSTTNTPNGEERTVGLKEPAFFEGLDWVWQLGVDWYRSLFAAAAPNQICGEASTTYTRFPHLPLAPTRMATLVPNVKLIYVVREPISRTYSHFIQKHSTELFPSAPFRTSFREFIDQYPEVVDASRYHMQIQAYLEHFPREQLLVILYEDLIGSQGAIIRKILDFIGIEGDDSIPNELVKANVTNDRVEQRARTEFRRAIIESSLGSLTHLIPAGIKSRLATSTFNATANIWNRRMAPPPITKDDRSRLSRLFEKEIEQLSMYLRRDLSEWSDRGSNSY